MCKSKKRLETIYEIDEIIVEETEKVFPQPLEKRSRVPYYLCCCLALGCFITLSLIITVSFNSSLLSENSTGNMNSIPTMATEKLVMTMDIVDHLNSFADQIYDRVDLWSNSITWMISSWSEQNDELLWIYTYLKYPQSCYDDERCHEESNTKIRTIFRELSNSLVDEFEFDDGRQIQLDWCNLVENTTEMILVSLVSIKTVGESHIYCKNIDPTILLSKPIDHIIPQDHEQIANTIDLQYNHLNDEENTNDTRFHSIDDHLYKSSASCATDTYTQVLLTWNSV